MLAVLNAEQMREADSLAIQRFGLPEILLMEHAALALVGALQERFGALLPQSKGVVLAGSGNNGGDALAAARVLHERGCQNIFIVLTGGERPLSQSTQLQLGLLSKQGLAWGRELSPELLAASDWVLDGMLGTGLNHALDAATVNCIELVNRFSGKKWIVSADIPSGLSADTGAPCPVAIQASHTVCLGFHKRGLLTGDAADHVGRLTLAPIQIPRAVAPEALNCFLYTEEDARRLPSRRLNSHKGSFGKVAIVAGAQNREGAAGLSALGALKAGAGLVTVTASEQTLKSLQPRLSAEIMTEALTPDWAPVPDVVLVVGPGFGTGEPEWQMLQRYLAHPGPLVLDADALTLLALHAELARKLIGERSHPTVLTPHPKEAAALMATSVEEIQRDRYATVYHLANLWLCNAILKGNGTLCASPSMPLVAVRAGDPGLAKGGTGDVLAGIVAAFLAQGMSAAHAVPLAVFVHGKASELLTQRSGHSRSSLASEVAAAVSDVLAGLECRN